MCREGCVCSCDTSDSDWSHTSPRTQFLLFPLFSVCCDKLSTSLRPKLHQWRWNIFNWSAPLSVSLVVTEGHQLWIWGIKRVQLNNCTKRSKTHSWAVTQQSRLLLYTALSGRIRCMHMCVCVLWAALLAVEDNGFGQLTNKDMTSSGCKNKLSLIPSLLCFILFPSSNSLSPSHHFFSSFFLFKWMRRKTHHGQSDNTTKW